MDISTIPLAAIDYLKMLGNVAGINKELGGVLRENRAEVVRPIWSL